MTAATVVDSVTSLSPVYYSHGACYKNAHWLPLGRVVLGQHTYRPTRWPLWCEPQWRHTTVRRYQQRDGKATRCATRWAGKTPKRTENRHPGWREWRARTTKSSSGSVSNRRHSGKILRSRRPTAPSIQAVPDHCRSSGKGLRWVDLLYCLSVVSLNICNTTFYSQHRFSFSTENNISTHDHAQGEMARC